jgi:protein-glutamine gamma-glutamyltransferase
VRRQPGIVSPSLSRPNLYWLATSLLMVAAPHAQRLPWWLTVLAAVIFFWRLYLAQQRIKLPRRAVIILLVAAVSAGIYLQYRTLFGRDAGVALLVIMLMLKLLELHSQRDGMLLIFLSYFLVLTNFLYSQTIPTAIYMLVCVWVITATMLALHHTHVPARTAPPWRTAGVLLVQSVPLMLVLFVLFPRVQGPLWGMPADSSRGSTGLSETMAPGSLSSLAYSDAVAFRVAFKGAAPATKHMYWRGPVLWDFDGRTWTSSRAWFAEPRYNATYDPVEYTVTVEPHGKAWLFALDLPGRIPPGTIATGDLQLLSLKAVTGRARYEMVSFLEYSYGQQESSGSLKRALRLPENFNPKSIAFARDLRAKHDGPRATMDAVLGMFAAENFVYTLAPPLLGQHSVDDFLFGTRRGFCEHYSSAFVVLMRAAGIPARVVTGYLGGEVNPVGNYMIVRQADAHAWTEVWFENEGWIRVDPTAAVSPARIERGISAAVDNTRALPLFLRSDSTILRHVRLAWDSAANSWNQWVLGYGEERQRALLRRAGLDDATWRTLVALMLGATAGIMLVLALITLTRLRARVRDPVQRAYVRFCNKLAARGLPRGAAEGPLAYAERICQSRPDLEPAVQGFSRLYVALRYGETRDVQSIGRLQRLARAFKP